MVCDWAAPAIRMPSILEDGLSGVGGTGGFQIVGWHSQVEKRPSNGTSAFAGGAGLSRYEIVVDLERRRARVWTSLRLPARCIFPCQWPWCRPLNRMSH